MKAVMMLAMLAVAVAAPHGEDKRAFLLQDLGIISYPVNIFIHAKNSFIHLVTAAGHAINFDHVLQLIIPMLTIRTTQTACHAVCVTEASVLGLAVLEGSVLSPACDQVCHAALYEIQKLAASGRR